MEYVILVDKDDNDLGQMEKMQAHIEAKLHRAFSVFIFNSNKEMMLQKRASHKYHSGGLWTNACCSHPRPGESSVKAAHRRLVEEMGFDCDITEKFTFLYKRALDNDLTEHELDHVFTGHYEGEVKLNEDEVEDWQFISLDDLKNSLQNDPQLYTEWFRIVCLEYWDKLFS